MRSKKSIKGILMVAALGIVALFFINISFAQSSATIKVETANLREKADSNSKILEQLPINQKVEILEQDGNWYKVKVKGITGYLRQDLLNIEATKKEQPKQVEVQEEKKEELKTEVVAENNEKTNVENNDTDKRRVSKNTKLKMVPSINATDIIELKENEEVDILEEINGWVCVQTNLTKGWIREERLKVFEEKKEEIKPEVKPEVKQEEKKTDRFLKTLYINTELVNMRKDANVGSEVLARLSINTAVDVFGEVDVWYKVKVNGKEGYISKSLLSDKKVETSRGTTNFRESKKEEKKEIEKENRTENKKESNSKGADVVATAKNNLGKKYVYGATGPNAFDCSGFTQYVFKQHNININRTAQGQYSNGVAISKSELQPGDLVMFGGSKNSINHVGIYIGGGNMIHAANPKRGVVIDTINSGYYYNNYVGARRVQ